MIFAAILSLTLLGLILGALLGTAARYLRVEGNPLQEQIEGLLPGSQCGQCGFPGCGPAAQAIAEGKADVTICPPGGKSIALTLANIMGIDADLSAMEEKAPMLAHIKEDLCIGCMKCFKRCPTDAIMGGPKQIHTVLSEACTGCEKCVDICPTECVSMRPIAKSVQDWYWPLPATAA